VVQLHRLLVIACVAPLLACTGRTAGITPAATPEATVGQFLAAVNAGSLDGIEQMYGDESGDPHWSRARNRQEILTIFQRLLQNDSSRVLSVEPDTSGVTTRRVVRVELYRADRRARVPFVVAQQRSGGWLVYGLDFSPLMPAPVGRRNP
jgi:hypothetical protein